MLKKNLVDGYVIGHFHCDSGLSQGYRGHADEVEWYPTLAEAERRCSELNAEMYNCLGDEAVNRLGETIWLWHPVPTAEMNCC